MRLTTVEEALARAIQGIVTKQIEGITYIPLAGLSTLTPNSMQKLIALSTDPKHASDFRSIDERVYIEEGFLYELFRNKEIAQITHVERLQGVELNAVNTDAPPLKF